MFSRCFSSKQTEEIPSSQLDLIQQTCCTPIFYNASPLPLDNDSAENADVSSCGDALDSEYSTATDTRQYNHHGSISRPIQIDVEHAIQTLRDFIEDHLYLPAHQSLLSSEANMSESNKLLFQASKEYKKVMQEFKNYTFVAESTLADKLSTGDAWKLVYESDDNGSKARLWMYSFLKNVLVLKTKKNILFFVVGSRIPVIRCFTTD